MSLRDHITALQQCDKLCEILRFGVVGTIATLIQYGIYWVCNQYIGWGTTPSITIGYIISFIINFLLSNYYTFKTHPSLKKGIGFTISHIINYTLQIFFLNLYLHIGFSPKYAPIPMFVTVIPINFLLVRMILKSKRL